MEQDKDHLSPTCANSIAAIDYRPIASCNTSYNCLSQMICNRLKGILPDQIQDNQSDFVEGWHVAHEITECHVLIRL